MSGKVPDHRRKQVVFKATDASGRIEEALASIDDLHQQFRDGKKNLGQVNKEYKFIKDTFFKGKGSDWIRQRRDFQELHENIMAYYKYDKKESKRKEKFDKDQRRRDKKSGADSGQTMHTSSNPTRRDKDRIRRLERLRKERPDINTRYMKALQQLTSETSATLIKRYVKITDKEGNSYWTPQWIANNNRNNFSSDELNYLKEAKLLKDSTMHKKFRLNETEYRNWQKDLGIAKDKRKKEHKKPEPIPEFKPARGKVFAEGNKPGSWDLWTKFSNDLSEITGAMLNDAPDAPRSKPYRRKDIMGWNRKDSSDGWYEYFGGMLGGSAQQGSPINKRGFNSPFDKIFDSLLFPRPGEATQKPRHPTKSDICNVCGKQADRSNPFWSGGDWALNACTKCSSMSRRNWRMSPLDW